MDLIETVVDHVLQTGFDSISPQTLEAVKTATLDTMGAVVAGSSASAVENLVELVRQWGGAGEAPIFVYGDRVPGFHAALVNGVMARGWDIDHVHEGGGGHLSASIVPTAFTIAEYAKRPITGKEFIVAIAIGTDLVARLRMAVKAKATFGWVADTFAPFGVVAVASRFLGCTREQTLAAMGIAYAQASGNSQGTVDGALTVRLQQGLAAKAGLLAIQLAQIGFTGPKAILEGVYGLYPLYARGAYDREIVTHRLGEYYEIVNLMVKPYPSCKHTHIPISAVIELVKSHSLGPGEIKAVIVRTNQAAYDKCAAGSSKRRPKNISDFQFSIPLLVATAIIHGKITFAELTEENWANDGVLRLADCVQVIVDPALVDPLKRTEPAAVEIETQKGERYVSRVDYVKGSVRDPMTFQECAEKFLGCVAIAKRPLRQESVLKFVNAIQSLEHIEDIRSMSEYLAA